MNARIITAVLAVPVLAAVFALAILWLARATMSQDQAVHRGLRLVEVGMSLSIAVLSVLTAESVKDRRWAMIAIGVVLAAWTVPAAISLLVRRRT